MSTNFALIVAGWLLSGVSAFWQVVFSYFVYCGRKSSPTHSSTTTGTIASCVVQLPLARLLIIVPQVLEQLQRVICRENIMVFWSIRGLFSTSRDMHRLALVVFSLDAHTLTFSL
jgi:hypothetical protein